MTVLYLGDDSIAGAAAYLTGVLQHAGLAWQHVNSSDSPPSDFSELLDGCRAVVVSDYPRERFRDGQLELLAQRVASGECGLVMLGGWESYHGRLGEYHDTILAEVLPVTMQTSDDRVNCPQPVFVVPASEAGLQHPILAGLPWNTPSAVGGFNRIRPKENSQTLLEAVQIAATWREDSLQFNQQENTARAAMLVVGTYGEGRVAALATDVAPHWIGQWVDWGTRRVTQPLRDASGNDAGFIEVGDAYLRFFTQLIRWVSSA